ncbi:hypothetical protein BJ165DRAFT_1070607 [Panaeolus papilionaceus]|nr:hypothetical protein BJ165DRAFT_1070607 [Panaeolus papilionaceus]
MGFAGGSGTTPDTRSSASMKREPEGTADLDTSQADREDRMRVQRLLEEFADLPINPIASSSSRRISHGANSSRSSESPSPPPKRDKGKYRARAKSARPSGPPNPTDIIDITDSPPTPYQTLSTATRQFSSKGKQKAETVDLSSFSDDDTHPGGSSTEIERDNDPQETTTNNQTADDESHLSSYTCPICFCAPTNATLTPCGHICCGECLFTAIKTTQQRVAVIGPAEDARCPVCRAVIPGWDGKGGGVFGLKIRAVFSL